MADEAPVTETPAPAPAAESAAAPVSEAVAAPVEGEEGFIPEPKSEAKPEGEAKDGKTETEAKADDADFLAETDDDKAKKDEADAPGDAKPEGESEAYQPFALPDGVELDAALVAEATPLFRKYKLDQDGAQELVSFYADKAQKTVQAYHDTLAQAHADRLKEWTAATKAHAEFGGAQLPESKVAAAKVLALEPAARKVLVEYGLDRNPHVFALLARLGTKLSEDTLVRDDAGAPIKAPPVRDADIMYS